MYEIERKYLLANDKWKKLVVKKRSFVQGYISPNVRVRLFTDDNKTLGKITIKSNPKPNSFSRMELEYDIPRADAKLILKEVCINTQVFKTRYHLSLYNSKNHYWTIDVYEKNNAGLIVAEIEMDSEKQKIKLPKWIGQEVTNELKYSAASLAYKPFKTW